MKKEKRKTKIGKIQEDFEAVRLDDVILKIGDGGTPSTRIKDYFNGKIPWVNIEDIKREIYDTRRHLSELGLRNSSAKLWPKGTIIFSFGASIGKVGIAKVELCTKQGIAGIVPNPEKIYNEFLYYVLIKESDKIKRIGQGMGSTIKEVRPSKLVKLVEFGLPPLSEQKKIAEILSTVDTAIQKVDETIAKTERLKKGLMLELLTKGIGHKEFKDTEIGRIPKEWEVVRLEDVVSIHDSKRIPLSQKEREKKKEIYPYCGANGIIDYIDEYIFDGEYLLLAEDGGNWGKFERSCYIMNGKFWVNNHAHIIQAISDIITNTFLLYMLNFMDLTPYIVGSTRGKLNQAELRAIKIPLPPLPEQKKIAEILLTVDKKLELERKRKEKLERVKKGLMNDLLTGRKRMKV